MSLLNLNKAIKKALSNIAPLDIQNVSLLEANNRVLSNNLKALKSHPPCLKIKLLEFLRAG